MTRRRRAPDVLEGQLDLFGAPAAPVAAPVSEPLEEELGPPGDLQTDDALRLDRNLAVLAGAGAGKTHSLVTMCLHLLGGARKLGAIECHELCLLTFTEKAADEMRGRLRERVEALALGKGNEPALEASFRALGKPMPDRRFWRMIRDDLGRATIGTFHALCTQLLTRAPAGSGAPAHFELLDEREAKSLLADLVERTLLDRIDENQPLRTLVMEHGFERVVQALMPIATRLREEGVIPAFVPITDGPTQRAEFENELRALRGAAHAAVPGTKRQQEQLTELLPLLRGATFETWDDVWPQMKLLLHRPSSPIKELREAGEALGERRLACVMAPYEAAVRELLTELSAAYEEALTRRGALDFTGLLIQARNVLRDSVEARADAQRSVKALLVDEFQDTNRLQLELVLLLAEKRKNAPRPISTAFEEQHREILSLPQEQGFLAVVGDRKQSIYEFRGADVSVFEVMAKAIDRNDGARAYLQHSRRSTPALVQALNAGFAAVLRPSEEPAADFESVYSPEQDDLQAVRAGSPSGPPLIQLVNPETDAAPLSAEEQRLADAEAVAKALAHGLSGGWTILDPDERGIRGGDVALLFQRFTQVEVYRQALLRHGVRHRVVRGRGFFAAQEIVDVASFLTLLADPEDAVSLSAVLRSPFVGLTDSEWVSLAVPRSVGANWGLDAAAVLRGDVGADVKELIAFRTRYAALRAERDRLGLRALVRVVLEAFELRPAYAASPFGEQALANLEKLVVFAGQRERLGTGVAAFGRELLALAEDVPMEAQAEVVDSLDDGAVTLCTVHQAKGLEWPLVVLPDLNTQLRSNTEAIRFDRTLGIGVTRPRALSELNSASVRKIDAQQARRARAEQLRLLYVAMTRARDRVVLGLRPHKVRSKTWSADVASFFTLKVTGAQDERLDVTALAPGRPSVESSPAVSVSEVRELVERARAPIPAVSRTLLLPVGQLQDHALCPRRFHFAHHVGLAEHRADVGDISADSPRPEARARGVAVHRLLELTPLELIGTPELPDRLRALRRELGLESLVSEDSLAWVERFWSTRFARGLSGARVERELPFALRLESETGADVVLRGQIDLLVATSEQVVVLDYKTTHAGHESAESYRFSLQCYALAARQFVGGALPVRAGLVFLRDAEPEPRFFPSFTVEGFQDHVVREAHALEAAQRSGIWSGQPRVRCEALSCGFVYRCHPDPTKRMLVAAGTDA